MKQPGSYNLEKAGQGKQYMFRKAKATGLTFSIWISKGNSIITLMNASFIISFKRSQNTTNRRVPTIDGLNYICPYFFLVFQMSKNTFLQLYLLGANEAAKYYAGEFGRHQVIIIYLSVCPTFCPPARLSYLCILSLLISFSVMNLS